MIQRVCSMVALCALAAGALLFSTAPAYPQRAREEYVRLYDGGVYAKALDIINKRLEDFYAARVDNKRVPIRFITMKEASKRADLIELFRNRKAEGFFIEDNPEISALHLYAARCWFKLSNLDYALNHYVQSLRFKSKLVKTDDVIYYEMAQVYKKGGYFNAYVNSLEAASSLNRDDYSYSLELGKALYTTARKKRAIFHLERYVNAADEPVSPGLYLMLANLYEDIGKYLETEKYYVRYLGKKPDDAYIQFALGYIAFKRTGNYPLAIESFDRALRLLPEGEVYRISKIHEYRADIALQELDFDAAVRDYAETIKYQDKISGEIKSKRADIDGLDSKIRTLKSSLLREENFEKYGEYEGLLDAKGKKELELKRLKSEYDKLNAGRVRWNIAYSLERLERLKEAIGYYRESIAFDYQPNLAREKIIKLELKIKRGY
jgi:hypothetical protein